MDIVLVVFFWLSLICVKPFVDLTEEEVNGKVVAAPDFTVMLTNPDYTDKIEDINALHWQWAENILKKDNIKHMNPETNALDVN